MATLIKKIKRVENSYLFFLPFLLAYIIYVLIFPTDGYSGDQGRYLMFAKNLLHGFYSPSPSDIDLRNGPGYPIILMPFVALNFPFIFLTLINACLHYLSVVFIFKALEKVVSFRKALIFSLFWGCYYIAYQYMSTISYEPISIFLVSALILCLTNAFYADNSRRTKKYVFLSGFVFGYLALTKVIFGYVVFIMVIVSVLFWLRKRNFINYRKGLFISLIACATTIPYLIYTYHLTGRAFYWGTGEENLYWMSTPYDDEYGDWKGDLNRGTVGLGNYNTPDAGDSLKAHHGKDYEEINKYIGLKRDDAFKRIAINNIKSHPIKYAKNIFYNIGRIIFHYPFSYAVQRTKVLFVFPINGIVLALSLLSLIPTLINWRKIFYPIKFMLLIVLLYLLASSLLSAETRVFALIVPVLLFWIAYIFHKSASIKLRFTEPDK